MFWVLVQHSTLCLGTARNIVLTRRSRRLCITWKASVADNIHRASFAETPISGRFSGRLKCFCDSIKIRVIRRCWTCRARCLSVVHPHSPWTEGLRLQLQNLSTRIRTLGRPFTSRSLSGRSKRLGLVHNESYRTAIGNTYTELASQPLFCRAR